MVAQQKMKEEEVTEVGADATVATTAAGGKAGPGSPKSRLAMLKRSTAKKAAAAAAATDPFRFQGNGVTYKAKLIGMRDVEAARGDTMCADAMRDAKAAVKASGAHKQRIQLSINIEGIKISDEKATTVIHSFPVSRISFIARDTTDARAFGFVFGEPNGKYKFYGIKTAQTADHAVLAIRDMFQIVYEMKRKQVEQMKQEKEDKDKKEMEENGIRSENGVLVADLLDLETELQNIEQGVNQLAHIPVVAGDEWPGEVNASINTTGASDASFGGATTTTASLVDVFGQQPFAATPRTVTTDPFGMTGSASFNNTTPSLYPMMGAAAPAQHASPMWGVSPMMMQQQQQQQLPHHHGFSSSTPNFSETNPFATAAVGAGVTSPLFYAPTAPPHNTPVGGGQFGAAQTPRDPFDTSAFTSPPSVNWNLGNENTAPHHSSLPHAHSFQATFSDMRSAPMAVPATSTTPTHQWEVAGTRKVSSLEEAFTKLVDMDSLVSQPTTKKNPFEHLINPPKVPLNALSQPPLLPAAVAPSSAAAAAATSCGVSHTNAHPTLVFPGKTNDPFADDFFN